MTEPETIIVNPMESAPMDGTPMLAIQHNHYRFLPYKPEARKQFKKKGRWQRLNEHGGWENCEAPDRWIKTAE